MGFFKKIEGEAAIVSSNGVYKQVDIYERDGILYAKVGGGFVKLLCDGSTTSQKLRLDFMSWDGPLVRTKTGYLCLKSVKGSRPLGLETENRLLGAGEGAEK